MAITFCTKPLATSRAQDCQLCARVREALRETGRPALRGIRVSVEDGHVCLRGQLPSYFLKQIAQTTAYTVGGVRSIRNEVVVI